MQMIERVARAIMMARDGCHVTDWSEAAWNPNVARALKEARAAIEAMRDPTEEMMASVFNQISGGRYRSQRELEWRAAIDAALKESEETK